MGLDITACGNVKLETNVKLDKDGYPVDYQKYDLIWINSEFPEQATGLVHEGIYSHETEFGFRAGSYSGYNYWRNALARMAGYPPLPGKPADEACAWSVWENKLKGPFSELINFSDCEGVIGWAVSAKLEKDFLEWDERAKAFSLELRNSIGTDWFYEAYENWKEAFTIAAVNGYIKFH